MNPLVALKSLISNVVVFVLIVAVRVGLVDGCRAPPRAIRPPALVRRLVLSDGRSLVLRGYFVDRQKQNGFAHWYMSRHLAERGIRVPAVYFRQVFPFPRGKADVEVLIEEFVEGQVVTEAVRHDATVRHRVVETLVQLHSDRSPCPGRPWLGSPSPDPMAEVLDKVPVRLDRIRKQLAEVTPQEAERCLRWFRERVARRPVPESYELIHCDWNRENVLLTPNGEVVVLDLVTMAYGCFESDLVDVRWMFFDEGWWREFCEGYFEKEPSRRERFEQNAPLFLASFLLIKAARQASGAGKALERGDPALAETRRAKSRKFWKLLIATMEGSPLG